MAPGFAMPSKLIAFFHAAFLRQQPRHFAVIQPETADRKHDDFPGKLSDRQTAAPIKGRAAYAVPAAEAGLAHLLPLDIDARGLEPAQALLQAASDRRLWAFGQVDAVRRRGYVWLPFNELVNTAPLHALLCLLDAWAGRNAPLALPVRRSPSSWHTERPADMLATLSTRTDLKLWHPHTSNARPLHGGRP